jgi:aerobic carbon-monoxide dehydrogenase small subunit
VSDAGSEQAGRFEATCSVNGREVVLAGHPMDRLLDLLRDGLGLTGTKEGCGEGECGACTVLVDGEPALSCLIPLLQCAGRRIETVEGIAADAAARPLLDRIVAAGGVQCGACTPGIAVTAWALLRDGSRPTREEAQRALAGNLCRCTGYEAILGALIAAPAEAGPERMARGTAEAGASEEGPLAPAASELGIEARKPAAPERMPLREKPGTAGTEHAEPRS